MLEDCLLSVARARGFRSLAEADFQEVEGFLFVSSPNSTTPFHLDAEDNFFVQIHGEKFFRIYDNQDGSIADEDAVEHSLTKHRNLKYDDAYKPRAVEFHMFGGDGCFVPYKWPHWVRTANEYSISMAITWRTKAVQSDMDLRFFNSILRNLGVPQPAPGQNSGLGCGEARVLSHRPCDDQPAARVADAAPRAAPHRARQEGELFFEGGVIQPVIATRQRRAIQRARSAQSRKR